MSSIIVVFPKQAEAKTIRKLLEAHGFTVTGACSTGSHALQLADQLDGGIVLCGYRFTDMFCTELLENLPRGFEMLLVASPGVLRENHLTDIVSVSMPLRVQDLLDTVNMMERNLVRRRKRARVQMGRPPQEQKLLDEAKALLIERNHMTEPEAHRYIQKTSMESGRSLVETAQMVLTITKEF